MREEETETINFTFEAILEVRNLNELEPAIVAVA